MSGRRERGFIRVPRRWHDALIAGEISQDIFGLMPSLVGLADTRTRRLQPTRIDNLVEVVRWRLGHRSRRESFRQAIRELGDLGEIEAATRQGPGALWAISCIKDDWFGVVSLEYNSNGTDPDGGANADEEPPPTDPGFPKAQEPDPPAPAPAPAPEGLATEPAQSAFEPPAAVAGLVDQSLAEACAPPASSADAAATAGPEKSGHGDEIDRLVELLPEADVRTPATLRSLLGKLPPQTPQLIREELLAEISQHEADGNPIRNRTKYLVGMLKKRTRKRAA